jgi:hypothetical protein
MSILRVCAGGGRGLDIAKSGLIPSIFFRRKKNKCPAQSLKVAQETKSGGG